MPITVRSASRKKIPDDNDVMDSALHVDDAVPAAERLTGLADQIEGVRDLAVIVGMFVGEHHFGCWGDRARSVAVHLLHLGRPLPAVVVEVEAEPADPLGGASA